MPDRPQQPDLAGPLVHREEQRVDDPEQRDHLGEQEQRDEHVEERVELALLGVLVARLRPHLGVRERFGQRPIGRGHEARVPAADAVGGVRQHVPVPLRRLEALRRTRRWLIMKRIDQSPRKFWLSYTAATRRHCGAALRERHRHRVAGLQPVVARPRARDTRISSSASDAVEAPVGDVEVHDPLDAVGRDPREVLLLAVEPHLAEAQRHDVPGLGQAAHDAAELRAHARAADR